MGRWGCCLLCVLERATERTSTKHISDYPTTMPTRTVDYTWVSCVADVDFEGGDMRDALEMLPTLPALQDPSPDVLLGLGGEYGAGCVLLFNHAPEAFGDSVLEEGSTTVIRVCSNMENC